jgi:predicted AlkP superfamily phosphohydrolase/phosphomutase
MVPRKLAKRVPDEKLNFEEALITGAVDLKQTTAISKRALKCSQIFLNKMARGGIVKEEDELQLKKEIKRKLIDLFKEKNISVLVKTKEELYGPTAKYAPDLTLYFEEKGWDTYDFFSGAKEMFIEPNVKQDAEHNLHGVIFTDLDLNFDNANIIDLAPTLLDYFNIKYPAGSFDGKSLMK